MKNSIQKNKKVSGLRKFLGLVLVFEFIFGIVFFGLGFYGERLGIIKGGGKEPELLSKSEARKIFIDGVMERMDLKEKIAQMIISQNPRKVKELALGGLILMSKDMGSLDKTKELVLSLEEDEENGVPRFLATDQEGGIVQRLASISDFYDVTGFSEIPEMLEIGETEDLELAKETGKEIAEQVKVVGLNTTFAPVLDVYSNSRNVVIGTRSFSSEAEVVAEMGVSLEEGLEEDGVLGVYKHFPGHGDTVIDSHYDLPVINKSLEELEEEELIPFVEAIKSGAKMMMVGHIALPEITGDRTPASLSSEIVTDLLKEKLGFSGLVITDGMNMGAIINNYGGGEAAVLAVKAGVDLILMPEDEDEAIEAIEDAVLEEEISEDEINDRVRKIIEFKIDEFWG